MTLRDKLKALTEPSREVDAEIAKMFDGWEGEELIAANGLAFKVPPINYTASLDAAVELVERELTKVIEPEWSLETAPGGYWACFGHERCTQSGALHTLPAVALLLALLEAKGA